MSIKIYEKKTKIAIVLMLAIALLTACNTIVLTEVAQEGRLEVSEDGFYLQKKGTESFDLVYTLDGEEAVLKTIFQGVDYNSSDYVTLSEFSNVMGYDGVILQTNEVSGITATYYTYQNQALHEIACSFGMLWTIDNDTIIDLDGDGVTELICNVTYMGDGAERTLIYQKQDDGIYVANAIELLDELELEREEFGVGEQYCRYDKDKGLLILSYIPKGEEKFQDFEIELDISKLEFVKEYEKI